MVNSVYSAFFREQHPYNFDEIKDSLKISDDALVKDLIRTMKSYNILRACKSELQDYENLSDQDLIFADVKTDSLDTVFVFKFVGIALLGNVVIKCYPKYVDIDETKVKEESLILALKALEKYNTNKTQDVSLYNGDDDKKQFNKLEVALFLLHDYFIHDLYTNQEEIIEINGDGEYLFDKTVEQNMAILHDGDPYYVEIFTRRNLDNDSDYFRQIHKCILNECSSDLEKTGLLDIFGLSSVEFAESKLEDFGEKEYILNRISSELGNQFITHRQTLLKTLYTFVESEYGNDTNLNLELLGTTSFNLVWEKACGEIFGNVLDSKINRLQKLGKLPNVKNTKFNVNDKVINLIEKARWELNKRVLETAETLEPDIITVDEKSKSFYILDGKYYIINTDDSKYIYNQPGIQDVVKQFAYQKAYQDFIKEYEFTSIGNAFLFPQRYSFYNETKKNIVNSGSVNLDLMQFYAFKLLAPIRVLELYPKFVFEKYISNMNCEKDLFASGFIIEHELQQTFDITSKVNSENSMFGFLRSDYFKQVKQKISDNEINSFPFFFYALGRDGKQYSIDTKALDSKYFIGYDKNSDVVICGEIEPDIQYYSESALKQILYNKGYSKEDFSAKSYFYLEVENPRIINIADFEKEGIKISEIKKNSIINGYAPRALISE